ncbi:MAG: hypothetical protein MJ208_00485 [Bacilli bacterium]|nr:hypothetical protein [Bacilli bacterium]
MKKLNPEKKCLLILLVFSLVVFCIFLPISIVRGMHGLVIGWSFGCIATFINMFLLFKSGHAIADLAKSNKGVGLSVLFYFLRFIIIAAPMIICALLQWYFKHEMFEWSLFTCAASVLPSSLIIVIFYHSNDEDPQIKK